MLPSTYQCAAVRNITPLCPERQRFGLGLDLGGGVVLRVALDVAAAEFLLAELGAYVRSPAGCQSPGSELMPSAPRSVPSEGV